MVKLPYSDTNSFYVQSTLFSMTTPKTSNTSTRRLINILTILLVLAIFLSLYFLKYVPQQKQDFNERAFKELEEVTDALITQDQAFHDVLPNRMTQTLKNLRKEDTPPVVTRIEQDPSGTWCLFYHIHYKGKNDFLKESLDSVMHLLTAGDNDIYDDIWKTLSSREKFVLYDIAVDGLANYKVGFILYTFINKGILLIGEDQQLHFMTHSFHNYVLNQSENETIVDQLKQAREQGSWQNFKIPLFLILAALGIFVFLTQDAVYQKMTGLFTSVGSLVPLLSRFFEKTNK